jgi:hypothetical protein
MAPFAPLFRPATFSPSHAPASLPSITNTPSQIARGFDAHGVANVPNRALGFATNSWLGKSTIDAPVQVFLAVFWDWHAP